MILQKVVWNFKQHSNPSWIRKTTFCDIYGISSSALSQALDTFSNHSFYTRLYIDNNYLVERKEKKEQIQNYCHKIYYAITYGYNIKQTQLAKQLASRSVRKQNSWNTFMTQDLFLPDYKSITDFTISESLLMFLRIASRYLYELSRTHPVINNY